MSLQLNLNMQVIGVTGHRDLDESDRPRVERVVNDCLAEIESLQPKQIHCLISGLAAGADQLVAQCALDRGWTLHAVLAASVDSFALTMSAIDAQRLRNDFLPRCAEVTTVTQDESEEISGYVSVARVIVEQAESLIALWNGTRSRGPGGTADTVTRFLEANPTKFSQGDSTRTVYWVRTRRLGESPPQPGPALEKIAARGRRI